MQTYLNLIKNIQSIDPVRYAKSRNYTNGGVTKLSAYIARGVIDTSLVLDTLMQEGYSFNEVRGFAQQLAWRDFFQRVWQQQLTAIDTDLKHVQTGVLHQQIPSAIIEAQTGIDAIDHAIHELEKEGYMHNHVRMYTAFLACNVMGAHWLKPAKWMYYHLKDGDWGSNALSWQWVAGTFSNKKYIANQENINRFTGSNQQGTLIDCAYEALETLQLPERFHLKNPLMHSTQLPSVKAFEIDESLPVLLYNYYNLSPTWYANEKVNRVLLLEPSHFEQYPISQNCLDFALELANEISDLHIYVGDFESFEMAYPNAQFVFKEHPLNKHYRGKEEARNWLLSDHSVPANSFFNYWKKCEKALEKKYASS
jgi:deoxyribodipyrimidine photo-lyase